SHSMRPVHLSRYPFLPSSIPKPEKKPMRELRDDSLVDLKFMMEDSGMGKTFIYSEIKKGKLPSPHKIGSASRWVYADYQNWKRSHFSPLQNVS
ncbi:TPA: helix-turn-helix transcriptional regulator, partial [Salmonella enterica]